MRNSYVTDTMALVLRLEHRRLPGRVRGIYQQAENGEAAIFIPALVFAEIGYLSEKQRIEIGLKDIDSYLASHPNISESPINLEVVRLAFHMTDISELHDRLIAAIAYKKKIPLLTNDPEIRRSSYVSTLW